MATTANKHRPVRRRGNFIGVWMRGKCGCLAVSVAAPYDDDDDGETIK